MPSTITDAGLPFYFLQPNDCIGDSLGYFNTNLNNLLTLINSLSSNMNFNAPYAMLIEPAGYYNTVGDLHTKTSSAAIPVGLSGQELFNKTVTTRYLGVSSTPATNYDSINVTKNSDNTISLPVGVYTIEVEVAKLINSFSEINQTVVVSVVDSSNNSDNVLIQGLAEYTSANGVGQDNAKISCKGHLNVTSPSTKYKFKIVRGCTNKDSYGAYVAIPDAASTAVATVGITKLT